MIDLLLRTSVILGVTWTACRLLPRATAATRHLLWHLAILAVVLAPLIAPFAPAFETPLAVPEIPRVPPVPDVLHVSNVPNVPGVAASSRLDLTVLWPLGSAAVLLCYAGGHIIGARRLRQARQAPEALQAAADALASHPVRVLVAEGDDGPFVRGIFRSSIVLPAQAESWDANRVRAVLLHELAHVRRGDCRVQLLAQVACAIYWFNPLIWIAARALRVERERACDDEVLAQGAMPSAYAADLLDLARARQRLSSSAILAMARPSELEGRLVAILASHRARVPARSSRFVAALAICALAVGALGARTSPPPRASTAAAVVPQEEGDRERAALKLALDSSPDAVPALIAALQDSDAQVREKAALGLGWRTDDRALAPLVTALSDPDSQVREKAALALGSLGDARAAAPLEAALKDPDRQVREKAATGLMFLRMGGDPDQNGKQLRAALSDIVNGLLELTR